ncbi:MAG: DUF6056 family protein [Solobacterium sp.]|nr:DUF6056 family protein [Solobacterium sp.]
MEKILKNKTRLICAVITAVFLLLFLLICRWTPAAGDDWVYASAGRWNSPFERAWSFYFTWSGRLLSEFYGFLIAPHKKIWNILNPVLFTSIYVLILKLTGIRKHPVCSCLLLFLLVFSVGWRLRMQTYTWIMGTTYVIPLLLFFIYLVLLREWLSENKESKLRIWFLASLNFCIPLYMENAAALIVGADMLVLIYLFLKDKPKMKKMTVFFLFACIGAVIILKSPGAHSRMVNDNAGFNALSVFEKIAINYDALIEHTYIEHQTLTIALSAVCALYVITRRNLCRVKYLWAAFVLLFAAAPFVSKGWLYLLETAGMFAVFVLYRDDETKMFRYIFVLLCALGANGVMLMSPIFDSRSGLYSTYLLFWLVLLLFEEIELSVYAGLCTAAALCVLCGMRIYAYYDMYHMVHLITIKRDSQIEYYRLRPDAGDAWILAYPDESIHSPNVQEGDTVHSDAFKEYYYLDESLHLVFYYLQDYTAEAILGA